MANLRRDDISIGEDKWIKFISVADRRETAIELDPILEPIMPFLTALETDCVAECCGIDAFALWPDDLERAARQFDRATLLQQLDAVLKRVAIADGGTFVSHRLNNYFDRDVLNQLLNHLAASLDGDDTASGRIPSRR
ncbi:MAG TPA: DUF6331 family protein [Caulifigura sp.]|nr:DUF6331 family protein [Caulifigura sp.]